MSIDGIHSLLSDHAKARGDKEPFWRVTHDLFYDGADTIAIPSRRILANYRIAYFPDCRGTESVVGVGATAEDAWAAFRGQTEVLA